MIPDEALIAALLVGAYVALLGIYGWECWRYGHAAGYRKAWEHIHKMQEEADQCEADQCDEDFPYFL